MARTCSIRLGCARASPARSASRPASAPTRPIRRNSAANSRGSLPRRRSGPAGRRPGDNPAGVACRPRSAHGLRARQRHLWPRLSRTRSSRPERACLRHRRHVALLAPPLHAFAPALRYAAWPGRDRPGLREPNRRSITATASSMIRLPHVPEHSIELEVVLLQYLLADRRPFKIVPLLTGGFGDRVRKKANPAEADDIAAWSRPASRGGRERGAGLLHHQRRPRPYRPEVRRPAARPRALARASRDKDQAILQTLEAADADRFLRCDRRREERPPHLRPFADLVDARSGQAAKREGSALSAIRPPAGARKRQLRGRGVLCVSHG